MAAARSMWRWLFPDSSLPSHTSEREAAGRGRRWPARCALRPWPRQRAAELQADLQDTAAPRVLSTRTFQLRVSTAGGIVDIRRKRWRPGYGMIPSAIAGNLEQAWATAFYIESDNSLNTAFTDDSMRRIWTNAGAMVALLLQAVQAKGCSGAYEHMARSIDPRRPGVRATARYIDALAARPHRVVHAYLQHTYKDGTRGAYLSKEWVHRVSEGHACLFVLERRRLYHFNPWGAQPEDARMWREICRHTRRIKYGGDAFHLGHKSCTEAFGHQPQSSEPFCDIWCASLALVLGLNPHRPLLEIMQYFKLKAPTRRYLQAKVFHTAMFLAEAQDAYAPGVVNIGERKKDAARALGNMRQAARGGAPIQCRQQPTKTPKKKSTPRTRTRVRSKNLPVA